MITPTHRKHNPFHDYRSRCIYHITMVVSDRCQVFGRMADARDRAGGAGGAERCAGHGMPAPPNGDSANGNGTNMPMAVSPSGGKAFSRPAGSAEGGLSRPVMTERELAESAWVELTPLGRDIQKAIQMIPVHEARKGNDVQILAACVMPEHIHFVLYIREPMKEKLGIVIRGFKQGCNKSLRRYLDSHETAFSRQLARMASLRILHDHALFAEDFDETRLRRRGQLRAMIDYVHNNPKHRWLRNHKPQWLLPIRGIVIAGRCYDAIGNVNLLALPRWQVHCRYKWEASQDIEARRNHQNECVLKARRNFALVSPFVMDHEAEVRDFCLKEGHSIIQLQDNGFSDLAQCPGGLYDYCVNGQLLLLVPSEWPYVEKKGRCSRQECVTLNGYAEEIVGE